MDVILQTIEIILVQYVLCMCLEGYYEVMVVIMGMEGRDLSSKSKDMFLKLDIE